MPKVSPIQGNFGTGEISPFLYGRTDMDRYRAALKRCLNYVPTVQGGLTRRPGTKFVEEVKDSSKKVRLVPFKFSATDAYMLEFGEGYIRFFTQYGQVLNADGDPLEVETDFTEDQLFELTFTQSADVLYICHTSYKPMKLSRYAPTAWIFQTIPFTYEPIDFGTLLPSFAISGTSGQNCTITASEVTLGTVTSVVNNAGRFEVQFNGGVPDPAWAQHTRLRFKQVTGTVNFTGDWDVEYIGSNKFILLGSTYSGSYSYGTDGAVGILPIFKSTDVDRRMKLEVAATKYNDFTITGYTNSLTVSARRNTGTTLADASGFTGALGLWYTGNGPAAACFFEDRLFFIGTPSAPQRIDGSKSGDYENFHNYDELASSLFTITASEAVSFRLNSSDVNNGKWLFSDEKGLLTGTLASEWVVKSASSQEAVNPVSISAKQVSAVGSADAYPVQVGKAVLFVQKSGRKVREFHYFYDVDGFRATDLTILSEHITESGIKQLAYQKDPQQIIWAVKNNGKLIGLTYERDIDNVRAGWHRHELGGDGFVESVACIPSPDGSRDDLWLVVRRTIGGGEVRYIEYLSKFFDDEDEQRDAYFVDCGLTYDNPISVTSISGGNPATVVCNAHGFSTGDQIVFTGAVDENGEPIEAINNKIFTVDSPLTNTFLADGLNATTLGTVYGTLIVRKRVQTIAGLDHLEGEEVSILGDGAVQSNKTVTGGSITLSSKACTVHVGLHAKAQGQLPRIDAGAADGTSIGKTRRTNRVGMMLHRSLNLRIGMNFEDMHRVIFRNANEIMGQAPELFSGIIDEQIDAEYDFDNQIAWEQDQPLPSTILAIFPQMTTQDR